MKPMHKKAVFFMVILFVFLSFSLGMSQTISIQKGPVLLGVSQIHRFFVADLGLAGSGSINRIFRVNVSGADLTPVWTIGLIIRKDGAEVLSGDTVPTTLTDLDSKTPLWNFELDDVLGGDFSVDNIDPAIEKKVLDTGEFPPGQYQITVQLKNGGIVQASGSITVLIVPFYLQPVYPVDTVASKNSLFFQWSSNLPQFEFHLFNDPRGNHEIVVRSKGLPQKTSARRVRGSQFATLLVEQRRYFWQVNGFINTSHGSEIEDGLINSFVYIENITPGAVIGLSEKEKKAIMDELIALLMEMVNKRASTSIEDFTVDRALLDNEVISYDEIMQIISLIKSGEARMINARFR
jgi:hypothetical protein